MGVCFGTIALVCVLSVFNGFGSLFEKLFNNFDPDLKIVSVQGKTFSVDDEALKKVRKIPEVVCFSEVLEENVMFRYKEKQESGVIMGVNNDFQKMVKVDSILVNGTFALKDNTLNYGVCGGGLSTKLGVGPGFIDPVFIYAPERTKTVNLSQPATNFVMDQVFISGIFLVQQQDYDNKFLIVSIDLARELFQYPSDAANAVELKISGKKDVNEVKEKIKLLVGDRFRILDRFEQQEDYYRIMKIEKWITYLILSFILLIAIFNIIGSLSMLIIDKKEDILTLRNMGADVSLIRKIFLFEGWMISIFGAIAGILLGAGFTLLQYYFGFVKLPSDNFIVSAYPVLIKPMDLVLIFITVTLMGFFAAYYPVKQIKIDSSSSQ
jgi:ABC-type lipoprotein release transport system permease subunit